MSDEDSADEMEEDCKLLNGDVSYGGRGVQRGLSLLSHRAARHTLSLKPPGAPPCCPPHRTEPRAPVLALRGSPVVPSAEGGPHLPAHSSACGSGTGKGCAQWGSSFCN